MHQARRRMLAPIVAAGCVPCAGCGELIKPGEKWHLDHDDLDRTKYLGACRKCSPRAYPGACLEKSPAQATGLTASGDRLATIVPAGAEHQFAGYEGLAVLVIFKRSGKARRTSEG
jgi:hypothetical protein